MTWAAIDFFCAGVNAAPSAYWVIQRERRLAVGIGALAVGCLILGFVAVAVSV